MISLPFWVTNVGKGRELNALELGESREEGNETCSFSIKIKKYIMCKRSETKFIQIIFPKVKAEKN